MVMATPSPDVVGQEFVRQYYTLLHKSPSHLHRFYSENSSFRHGGLDKAGAEPIPLARGQKEINDRIEMLNFNEARAKIKHVDSQASVGDSVVIQVTGELSNNNGPLRRFMQTFVLAPQTPVKYYVHNDIFAYQDEVFRDTDSEEDQTPDMQIEDDSGTASDPAAESYYDQDAINTAQYTAPQQQALASVAQPIPEPAPVAQVQVPDAVAPAQQQVSQGEDVSTDNNGLMDTDAAPAATENYETPPEEASEPSPGGHTPDAEYIQAPAEPVINTKPEPAKPFSWSNVVRRSNQPLPAAPAPADAFATSTNTSAFSKPAAVQQPAAPVSVPQQTTRERPAVEQRPGIKPAGGKLRPTAPDSHQLFVGNLQADVLDNDLKELFGQYGTVVDVKVSRTGSNGIQKNPISFITFDSEEAAQNALEKISDNGKPMLGGRHLNVEVKKPLIKGQHFSRPNSGRGRGDGDRVFNRGGPRRGGPPRDRVDNGGRASNGGGGFGSRPMDSNPRR